MLQIKFTDNVTNKKVRENMAVKVEDDWGGGAIDLAKRKLRYAGHILRGSEEGLLQLVLEGKVEGRKGRGRRRRKWGDDAKEWAGTNSMGDAKRNAEIRVGWRKKVSDLQFEDAT